MENKIDRQKAMYKKLIMILPLIGIVMIISFIIFYGFQNSTRYSFVYVFRYLGFPCLAMLFFIVKKYRFAVWLSIIGNVFRILMLIGTLRWLLLLFIAPVFVVPQIVFIKQLKKHEIIQKGKKIFLIIDFIVLFIIYGLFISLYIYLLATSHDAALNLSYVMRLLGAVSQVLIYLCIIFKFVEPIEDSPNMTVDSV